MRCGEMTVFPLFAEPVTALDYLLAHEAMAAGTMIVREVSEEGSVSELLVENGGDQPVLFVEGEEICGGKQNRLSCGSILVAGRSRTRIPVACVERGRGSTRPGSSCRGFCCPPTLRHLLKRWRSHGHLRPARQSAVALAGDPAEARATATSLSNGRTCPTCWRRTEAGSDDLRRSLPYPEGASGITVAIGGKFVSA